MITHDLGVVARVAHEVVVMYGGRAAEQAPVDALFAEQSHPYTRGLLDSLPRLDDPDDSPLRTIPGSPPSLLAQITGCGFLARCPRAAAASEQDRTRCAAERPPLAAVPAAGTADPLHLAACHLPGAGQPATGPPGGAPGGLPLTVKDA
jgi:peptide/nickel transport system ATP-binding protein